MRWAVALVVLGLWAATPACSVQAQDPHPGSAGQKAQTYGWQPLLWDLGTSALTVAILAEGLEEDLYGVIALSYALGPPLVHLAHRNLASALTSFGVRAGSVVAIAAGVVLAEPSLNFEPWGSSCDSWDPCSREDEPPNRALGTGLLVLGTIGVIASIFVDANNLSEVTVPDAPQVSAWLDPQGPGGGLVLGGPI